MSRSIEKSNERNKRAIESPPSNSRPNKATDLKKTPETGADGDVDDDDFVPEETWRKKFQRKPPNTTSVSMSERVYSTDDNQYPFQTVTYKKKGQKNKSLHQ